LVYCITQDAFLTLKLTWDWHGEDTGFSLDLVQYRIRLETGGKMACEAIRCSRSTYFVECLEGAGSGVVMEKRQRENGGECSGGTEIEKEGNSY